MNCKRKGTAAEHRAIRLLEASGFLCSRSAGSLGLFDVVGVGPLGVRLVQVKSGTARLSGVEREAITQLRVPANTTKEYWRFLPRATAPVIEVIP